VAHSTLPENAKAKSTKLAAQPCLARKASAMSKGALPHFKVDRSYRRMPDRLTCVKHFVTPESHYYPDFIKQFCVRSSRYRTSPARPARRGQTVDQEQQQSL
jgi:hypothetical protein